MMLVASSTSSSRVHEAAHHLLELPLAHLPVRDADPRAPGRCRGGTAPWPDGADAVVDEVDLPAALQLGLDRLLHRARVELHHEGADGAPVLGRRGDDGEVAHAGQAHVQRARDGRRGEREHVHQLAELLQPLLVGDAEALLLVHHHQAQVLEGDVGGEQPVGADQDVDLALRPPP